MIVLAAVAVVLVGFVLLLAHDLRRTLQLLDQAQWSALQEQAARQLAEAQRDHLLDGVPREVLEHLGVPADLGRTVEFAKGDARLAEIRRMAGPR